MHGKTQKARDNWYKTHYSKALREIRYIKSIIHKHKHFTNWQVLDEIIRTHSDFDEITWDYIQLVRSFKYAKYSEKDLLTQLLHHGYIKENDLHLRRKK